MKTTLDLKTVFGFLVRTAIAAAGGGLVQSGDLDPANIDTVAGAATIVAITAWSWFQKRQAAKKLALAKASAPVY